MPQLFNPGVAFAVDKLLKLGIILIGVRRSFSNLLTIDGWSIPIIVSAVLLGLIAVTCLTRVLKLPGRLGTLMAIGTSICGTSAVLAAAPGIKATDGEVADGVANITVLGIIAMFAYPYLATVFLDKDVLQVDLFLGTSIHDTTQVAGAGLVCDQSFGQSFAPVGNASVTWGQDSSAEMTDGLKTWAEHVLATAMAAVGLSTAVNMLRALGLKPFAVGFVTTKVAWS